MDATVKARQSVDVVIPVFNGRETICAALASVLAQSGGLIRRIIIVDDGSSDGTAQVVQSLESPLIELLRTPNYGVARARNFGIERSTTEWVAFLDADDVWMPGKLQAQLAIAQEYGVGFVCGSVSEQSVMPSGPISVNVLARGNFVATSSVLVKRNALQQIFPVFTPGMSFAEDYLAWLKCLTLTSGYYLSTKLVDYVLSARPRYCWGEILRNFIKMNLLYAGFLRKIDVEATQRLGLTVAVFLGSLKSVLSIIIRFIRSYRTGLPRK